MNSPVLPSTPAAPAAASQGASDGLHVTARRGDGCVLLAFNFEQAPPADFMGFAIACTPPGGGEAWLRNRLAFDTQVHGETTPQERHDLARPSLEAPFQKFRWVDFSSASEPGLYTYRVRALRGAPGDLRTLAEVAVALELGPYARAGLEVGFTRSFLSSQAYVDRWHNAGLCPKPQTLDFDPAPYEPQYAWLGYHARKMVFTFLEEALADPDATLDVLAYDLDEPRFVALLQRFGSRLRAVLDDADLHTGPHDLEVEARARLEASAGPGHIKAGHFHRFAHCKILIRRDGAGRAVKVLAGSANFSLRGFYVQANNVLVFSDPEVAARFGAAFDASFTDMAGFARTEVAAGWEDLGDLGLAFSPHRDPAVSLTRVADAIRGAKASVFFAIMNLDGGGPVLAAVEDLLKDPTRVFTYGITQNMSDSSIYKPCSPDAVVTPFDYLAKHVPPPFDAEISGGRGQVIHDKFVVVDAGTDHARVYTGSSNLSSGGEAENGDCLLELRDPEVAWLYAVNALGLFDHFHFRAVQQSATVARPLCLDATGAWVKPYYTPGTVQARDRMLFCPIP